MLNVFGITLLLLMLLSECWEQPGASAFLKVNLTGCVAVGL